MEEYLFANYLTDPAVYDAAVAFWRDSFKPILEKAPRVWKDSWLATSGCNGTPFRDGDPMYSAVALDKSRGIRVRQDAQGQEPGAAVWIYRYGKDDPDYHAGAGMPVIVLSYTKLSMEIAEVFKELGRAWIAEEADEGDILRAAESEGVVNCSY